MGVEVTANVLSGTDKTFVSKSRYAPSRKIVPSLLGLALTVSIFTPYAIAQVTSPRLVLLGVLLAIIAYELATTPQMARVFGLFLVVTTLYVPLVFLLPELFGIKPEGIAAGNVQRYFVILPVGLCAGWLMSRSSSSAQYVRSFVIVAILLIPFSLIEIVTVDSLFGRNYLYFVEYGRGRSLLASDHPLVLGTLYLVAMPLANVGNSKWAKVATIWLFIGTLTTGSEGPIGLGFVCLALALFPALAGWASKRGRLIATALVIVAGVAAYFSTFVWTATVEGTTSGEYSRGYRGALYAILPRLLTSRPFGFGPGALPEGQWFIASEFKGVRDLSISVDSEIVYIVAVAGVFGLLAYALCVALGLRLLRTNFFLATAMLALTLAGTVLALSVWDTLITLWAVLIGASLHALTRYRDPWEGPSAPPDVKASHRN